MRKSQGRGTLGGPYGCSLHEAHGGDKTVACSTTAFETSVSEPVAQLLQKDWVVFYKQLKRGDGARGGEKWTVSSTLGMEICTLLREQGLVRERRLRFFRTLHTKAITLELTIGEQLR